jgi:uncharacterized protein (DUF983 family)
MDSSHNAQRCFLLPIIYCKENSIRQEAPAGRDGKIYSGWWKEFVEETSCHSSVSFSFCDSFLAFCHILAFFSLSLYSLRCRRVGLPVHLQGSHSLVHYSTFAPITVHIFLTVILQNPCIKDDKTHYRYPQHLKFNSTCTPCGHDWRYKQWVVEWCLNVLPKFTSYEKEIPITSAVL